MGLLLSQRFTPVTVRVEVGFPELEKTVARCDVSLPDFPSPFKSVPLIFFGVWEQSSGPYSKVGTDWFAVSLFREEKK